MMETIGENSTTGLSSNYYSSDEFEGFEEITEQDRIFSRSDSGDDFEGFDGLCDAQKTVRKFECIQEAIREWKRAFTRNDKDSCFKKDCYVNNEKYTCKYCVNGSLEMCREENNNYKINASSYVFDKKPPKKKFLQKCHIESDTTNEIGNFGKENPDPESHSDNKISNRIGLQQTLPLDNKIANRIGLQPTLSLEYKNRCPYCSVLITGYHKYSKHVLDHRTKADSCNAVNQLPNEQTKPNRGCSTNENSKKDEETGQMSNWKKFMLKNYSEIPPSDCNSLSLKCLVPKVPSNAPSEVVKRLRYGNYTRTKLVTLNSILKPKSQVNDSQPQVHVMNSIENFTSIDKFLSDETQSKNTDCGICNEKFVSTRKLMNHLHKSHLATLG